MSLGRTVAPVRCWRRCGPGCGLRAGRGSWVGLVWWVWRWCGRVGSGSRGGRGPSAGVGVAVMVWAAMKSSSLISGGWAMLLEITQSSGWFHRWGARVPGVVGLWSVRCRFQTCRPV